MRTNRLRPEPERWNWEAIVDITATPRAPDPNQRHEERREQGDREQRGEGIPQAPPAASSGAEIPQARVMPEMVNRRDFRITRALLERVGYSDECPGCDALRRGASQQSHTPECRQRIQLQMQQDPVLAQRLHQRDVRHGLAPPEEAAAPAEQEDPAQEPASSSGLPRAEERPEREDARSGEGASLYSPTSPAESMPGSANDPQDPGLPRGVGRSHEEEPNARRVRQRQDDHREHEQQPRGVVRPRESEEEEENRPSAWRRVGAVEKCLMDVIEIHDKFMKERGLLPDQRCTRAMAREMIDELDKRHAARLERYKDEQRNETCSEKRRTGGIAEAYSPPRLTEVSTEFGVKPRWSLDLTTVDSDDGEPWDFNNPAKRLKAVELLKRDEPDLIMVGPICSPFCSLNLGWNFDRMPVEKVEHSVADGMRHLSFAVHLCMLQVKAGRYFAFEHPVGAASWQTRVMRMLARLQGCKQVEFDFCAYGMRSEDELGSGLVKKRTRLLTNARREAEEVEKAQCRGGHRHVRLVSGRAGPCQQYPVEFCRAICRGLARQIDDDKKSRQMMVDPKVEAIFSLRRTTSTPASTTTTSPVASTISAVSSTYTSLSSTYTSVNQGSRWQSVRDCSQVIAPLVEHFHEESGEDKMPEIIAEVHDVPPETPRSDGKMRDG